MKLKAKIILSLAISTLTMLLVGGYFIYFSMQNALQDTIGASQLLLARETLDKVDRFLNERYVDMQVLAQDVTFQKDIRDTKVAESVNHELKDFQHTTGLWDSVALYDRDAYLRGSTENTVLGNSEDRVHEREIIEKVLRTGEASYSDAYLSEETGEPAMLFAAPVKSETSPEGPIIAVALGYMAWPSILDIIGTNEVSLTHLHSNAGQLIAASDVENRKLLFRESFKNQPQVSGALHGGEQTNIGPSMMMSGNQAGMTGAQMGDMPVTEGKGAKQGAVLEAVQGQELALTSAVPEHGYRTYKGNGWALTIETPTTIAFGSARSAAIRTLLILIPILLVGAISILFLIIRFVVMPINKLSSVTEKIAAGNLDARAEVTSRDEVGLLASAFNSMTENLKASYSELESKVKTRTAELSQKVGELEEKRVIIGQEEQKLSVLLENLPIGVVMTEAPLGRVVSVNRRGVRLLGGDIDSNTPHESSREIYKMIREDGTPYPQAEQPIAITLKTGTPALKNDMYTIGADGEKVALRFESVPVRDEQGAMIFVIAVFDDVTKERAIDNAKTEFVSLASHQLRTPLSSINWYTEMLLAGDAGEVMPKQRKYLEEIYHGNQRMVALVNALLNVSRLELGTFAVDPAPTDIVLIARDAIKEQIPQISERKINLTTQFADDIPMLNTDPKLIRIIFQNLISNAIKYTPEGGAVTASIQHPVKNGPVEITVSDTGYGIPKQAYDRIFTKLFRADNVKEKDTEGTGLGLYIVKSIIAHSGGTIWFDSELGKGTTFHISLPVEGAPMGEKGNVVVHG